MRGTPLGKLIEEFGRLPLDDQEYAADVLRKQIVEAKREALYRRAKAALANVKKGKVSSGTMKDLQKDIEGD
jgi:hypothetical protein